MTASPDQDQGQAAAPGEGVDPATGQLSPEVRRELARQLAPDLGPELAAVKREEQAAAEWAKATADGPCSRCGARESWPRPGKGGWFRDDRGAVCARCDAERREMGRPEDVERPHGRPEAPILPDSEHRAKVIARLIGPERARWQWAPFLVERARELLPWYSEVRGAVVPGEGQQQFAYVDVEALAASLKAKPPPPAKLRSRGRRHRCPGCGCKGECWQAEQVAVTAPTDSRGELSRAQRAHFRVTWTCHTCRHVDVELLAEQLRDVAVRGLVGG